MSEARKDLLRRLAVTQTQDDIGKDWNMLVKNGTVEKIMTREEEYKQSGGYPELSEKDIGKEPGE